MGKKRSCMRLLEWNKALVTAIFLDPERAGRDVCRIDATGQLLERISGIKGQEDAKHHFIAAFGQNASQIRQIYRQTSISLTQATSIPNSFAALYLTLLAGSGDDNTSEEGHFRRRFAFMLNMEELASIDFAELPRMWREFARWCERRSKEVGDCARLILPDPRNEKLIGHSKRLAFPTFADEKRLRQLIGETGVSSNSSFQSVKHAIFSRLNDFSSAFREEALIFDELVTAGRNEDAFNSPLWGALRDIGLAIEKKTSESSGHFCLELDLADPMHPELVILTDERGVKTADLVGATPIHLPRPPYTRAWHTNSFHEPIKQLISTGQRDRNFSNQRISRALQTGCLPLFPDRFGVLSSDGEYYDDGPIALIANQSQTARFTAIASHLGVRVITPIRDADRWSLILIESISRPSLERLSHEAPSSIQGLFQPAWKQKKIHMADAARYGDAILLNPTSSPKVWLKGATEGSYELIGTNGTRIATGKLETHEDGFRISPIDLVKLNTNAFCIYQLYGPDTSAAAKFSVLTAAPLIPPKPHSDPQSWLCDGPGGQLDGLELARPEAWNICFSPEKLLNRYSGENLFSQAPRAVEEKAQRIFLWLGEVLLTRFQQRATLPFEEIQARVAAASEAEGIQGWIVQRALFASGWLVRVQRHTAPYQVVALGDRVLMVQPADQGARARLCGLLSKNELAQLRQLLHEGESCMSTVPQPGQISIGTLTLELKDAKRASPIAEALGWRLRLVIAKAPCPLASGLQKALQRKVPAITSRGPETYAWDENLQRWSEGQATFQGSSLFRTRGNQRDRYWGPHRNATFRTDSFPWALILARHGAGAQLGSVADEGGLKWHSGFPSIPTVLSNWWMQDGGGSVGIGTDGAILFLGKPGIELWDGYFGAEEKTSTSTNDSPSDRRDLALRIRRKAWNRNRAG